MKIKKKILLLAIGPVLLLGIVTMALTLTMMRGSMLDEIQAALKGTAAATLAAYDQNAGQYVQSTNGYVWKGNYNVSKSGSLVDRIKENTGMDVTFFYGKTRIMTSAKDKNGARVLRSEVGEAIVKQVLQGKKEYFSDAVSIEGTLNYGYFMPVYQENSDSDVVGMVFVGTNKQQKDAIINQMLITIAIAVGCIMLVCIGVAMKLASSMSKNINTSVHLVRTIAEGNLEVDVKEKLLKQKDEIGDLSRATVALRDTMQLIILEISDNAKSLVAASQVLEKAAEDTGYTMDNVREAVHTVVHNSEEQAENSRDTSLHMKRMGDTITKTSIEVESLNETAALMQESSEKAAETIANLCSINEQVEAMIKNVQEQTNQTNMSVQKIQEATAFIASVAEETNLLSLNASIEAARAGEAGRGFAVVASEIGTLAKNSADSVANITELINEINKLVENAVSQAGSSACEIAGSAGLIHAAVDTFHTIFSNIQDTNELMKNVVSKIGEVDEVATNVAAICEEQAASSDEILATSESMLTQAKNITRNSEQVESASENLAVSANQLSSQIEQFQI